MKRLKCLAVLLSAFALSALAGCGSDNREHGDRGTAAFRASLACIGCHGLNKVSPVTGVLIVEEWKKSVHNTRNAAGCLNCHANPNGHPNGGSIDIPSTSDAVCDVCHNATTLGSPHFSNFTSVKQPQFVSAQDATHCRVCHNPHDNTSLIQINHDFAGSGHGGFDAARGGLLTAKPFTDNRNWPTSTPCVRCHTSTGYVSYVNSPTRTITTFTGRNEILGCKTCHVNYSWQRRPVSRVIEPQFRNLSSSIEISFDDVRESNICMTCHIGREAGDSIRFEPGSFANKQFINSHYLTAGGVIFAKTGYEYDGLNYANAATFLHDDVGMGTGENDGPCVGCHMKTSQSHKFLPVVKNSAGVVTAVISTTCANCHTGGFAITPAFLEERKASLAAASEALKQLLSAKGVFFADTNPYFFKDTNANGILDQNEITSANRFTNWEAAPLFGVGNGKNSMGAAFNLNMIIHDPGAHVHNQAYVRRLIHDSIDWISDGALNGNVEAAINSTSLSATQKSTAVAYLLGAPGGSRP